MTIARGIASALVRLASRLLPVAARPWGQAMRYEVEAIDHPARAIVFALGCLAFAARAAVVIGFERMLGSLPPGSSAAIGRGGPNMDWINAFHLRPRLAAALCAIAATGLGFVYLAMAGAPARYFVTNGGAMVVGFAAAGLVALCARAVAVPAGTVALSLGAALLLTGLFGTTVDGAARWIPVGGLFVQPSLLVLPVLAICYARDRSAPSTLGIAVAALALAIQPDRAMSGALAAGMAALVLVRPERNVAIAAGAAACGFAATLLRADIQPAMPYVDQILYTSFAVHPLAGVAVLTGSALLIVPAIAGRFHDADHAEAYAVFGAVWLAAIVAAALGNYPTPLVGYGGSAIIGYVVSLLGLPPHAELAGRSGGETSAPADVVEHRDLRLSHA